MQIHSNENALFRFHFFFFFVLVYAVKCTRLSLSVFYCITSTLMHSVHSEIKTHTLACVEEGIAHTHRPQIECIAKRKCKPIAFCVCVLSVFDDNYAARTHTPHGI